MEDFPDQGSSTESATSAGLPSHHKLFSLSKWGNTALLQDKLVRGFKGQPPPAGAWETAP